MKWIAKLMIVGAFILVKGNAWTQNSIAYDYDGSGNRIDKHIILLKMGRVLQSEDSLQIESVTQKDTIKEIYADKIGTKTINIYPNPTEGILNVEIQGYSDQSPTLLTVYDLSGKILIQRESQINHLRLDFRSYSKGIYILKIQSSNESKDWKIIKE